MSAMLRSYFCRHESISDRTLPLNPFGDGALGIGRLKDALNEFIKEGVKLSVRLLRRESFDQRPREACHDTVISAQPVVCLFPRIATRKSNYPHDIAMADEIGVEIVSLG